MARHSFLPSFWRDPGNEEDQPFFALRKQIDDLFEDFGDGIWGSNNALTVQSNVSETDGEICITAELPGMEQKDIHVTVSGNTITIKGEKKSEEEEKKEDEGRQFHRMERSYGSFCRTMRLPFEIDADAIAAEFKNGLLTVTIPKPAEAIEKEKKVQIKSDA